MALFTNNADLRLSMLTQIVQVEDYEMESFADRRLYHGFSRAVEGPLVSPFLDEMEGDWAKCLRRLINLRNLSCEILAERASVGKTHIDFVQRLSRAYSENSKQSVVGAVDRDADGYVKGVVALSVPRSALSDACMMILEDLVKIINKDIPVKVCPECKSPFPVNLSKPEHRYCSDRCGNRERTRRYHQVKNKAIGHDDSMVIH